MSRTCPRCEPARPLQAMETSEGPTTDFCGSCGGIFFDPGELLAFVGSAPDLATIPDADLLRPGPACPGCGDGMSEVVWPGGSALHLDLCPKGGVWVDRGELGRLRKLVPAGQGRWGEGTTEAGETIDLPVRAGQQTRSEPDHRWLLNSVLIVLIAQVVTLGLLRFLGSLAELSDGQAWSDPLQLSVASVVGFFLGGLVSRRASPNHTVWEPAAAAVPAAVIFALLFHAPFGFFGLIALLGGGVFLTMAGAAVGERLQD